VDRVVQNIPPASVVALRRLLNVCKYQAIATTLVCQVVEELGEASLWDLTVDSDYGWDETNRTKIEYMGLKYDVEVH
jgi:hypothetical protein